jgi:hypothetical protein
LAKEEPSKLGLKNLLAGCLILVVLAGGAFWGCSDRKEPGTEKGVIQKMNEATAKEAVNQIRTPIEKARSVAKQQEEKNRESADAVKNP